MSIHTRTPLERSLDDANEVVRNLTAKRDKHGLTGPEARTLARNREKANAARTRLRQLREKENGR